MTDTYSEEWRAECEARYVINMTGKTIREKKEKRAAYIQKVRERRGNAMADKLIADVERLYPSRNK